MGKEVVRAKAKFQRKLTSGTLFTFLLAYFSHNRLLERPLCIGSGFYGKITVFQTFWPGLNTFKICLKCDHYMRCPINQEMLWPTNGQKQPFYNNMDSIEIHFKL